MAQFACEAFGIPLPAISWIKLSNRSTLAANKDDIEIAQMTIDSYTHVSNLTFLNTTRTDQSEYTCVGSNGITNVIGSPENDTINLLVQGQFLSLLSSTKYSKCSSLGKIAFSNKEQLLYVSCIVLVSTNLSVLLLIVLEGFT